MEVVVGVLVIEVLADAVGGIIAIALKFVLPASCSLDVLFDVTVALFAGALAGAMPGALTGIFIQLLADVNASAFAVVMPASEFPVPSPLTEFSLCAAIDCRPLALLDCTRDLQA